MEIEVRATSHNLRVLAGQTIGGRIRPPLLHPLQLINYFGVELDLVRRLGMKCDALTMYH